MPTAVTKLVPTQEPEPEPTTVAIHIKFPKCTRALNQYPDIKSISTEDGIITRAAFQLNNTEQQAIVLSNPSRYTVDGVTIPGAYAKQIERKLQAKFDCVYYPEEFLRIEDSCIVLSRNGETILLSNELMALHEQTATVVKHEDMYYLEEDTEYSHPISTQLITLKEVTIKQ